MKTLSQSSLLFFPLLGILSLLGAACSAPPADASPAGEGESASKLTAPQATETLPPRPPAAISEPPQCFETDRYTVIDDFVVDHANEARVWERLIDPDFLFTFEEAAAYCSRVTLGRQTTWRVPTAAELVSLELHPAGLEGDPRACSPAIDQNAFPDTPAKNFWTATTRPDQGDAISIGFDDGREHPSALDTKMHVRCVTDP